jgi:hypothetical protein
MTMRSHLADDVLLDVIEGAASAEATRHAGECAECARRLADARAGLSMAAGAGAPEPPPLYWNAFRRRVATAIEADSRPRRRFGGFFVPALLATAAMVAVATFLPREPGAPAVAPAPRAASSALPAPDDGADTTASAEDLVGCRDVAACVASLTDEESRAVAEALRAALAQSGDL